jgi:hypothetical protein
MINKKKDLKQNPKAFSLIGVETTIKKWFSWLKMTENSTVRSLTL